MNNKASLEELDNESDEISSTLTSPNGVNGSANNSGKMLEKTGSLGINKDEITLEDEKELAGYNDDLPELLTKEYRIKQDEEEPEGRSTSEKPSVRMGLVLTATATIMGVVGFVWFGFLAPKPARQKASNPSPSTTPKQLEDESAELKGKLAFQDQRRQLETKPDIQKQRSTPTKPQTSLSPVVAKTPSSPPPVRQTPTVLPPPRTVFVRQPSPPPPQSALFTARPIQRTQPTQPIQEPIRAIQAAPPAEPSSAVDPFERWSQLASLGQTRGLTTPEMASNSQGQPTTELGDNSFATSSTPAPTITAFRTSPTALSTQNNASPVLTRTQQQSIQQGISTVSIGYTGANNNSVVTNATAMTDGEMGILNRSPVNQDSNSAETSDSALEVAIGTSVNARVVVPMLWDESGESPTNGRFAIQLTEDMQSTDGSVALPTGTILITQVESVNRSNRLVNMSVVALVYPDSQGHMRQEEIPSGNLLIRGKNNQPLIAQGLFDKGSQIAKQDLLIGVISSLGRVGEIINQPRTQSSSSSSSFGFSQSTVTTTSNPNVLAAALEGFFKVTGDRLAKRSDQAVQEMLKKPNVAVVPEGTKVSVFVNSFLRVRR
ncbi:hypothetical protein NIES4075_62650 [Tolypothrix sp. NIES-4075]|uniref:TrbI/VirB10 family protein n=1 Tax=Tolypothrix sp. NIES-4075 TaxID=2005459 RepID=UPI000B5CCE3E|nr:TrbI/VirB10 family protein [Tolypothrix sp. NIES-4075]GAX45244.1 hypothetical protein NIES4075_62650 [Tolypothrix sp. NIES-4075]